MKTTGTTSPPPVPLRLAALAACALLLSWQPPALAQGVVTDNFDSGSLSSQWQVRNVCQPAGGYTSDTFPANGTGKALRMQRGSFDVTLIGFPSSYQAYGTGRAWLFRTNNYTDFYVAMDLVDWNNLTNQALVLLARATGFDDNAFGVPGLGTMNGYVCNYDNAQDGTGSGDRLGGQFQINMVTGEDPNTIATAEVTLTPGHTYRQILKAAGTTLTAQLYDIDDLTQPIATIVAEDTTYAAGKSGIVIFHRDDAVHPNRGDMTVDNYYSGPSDPNTDIAPAIRHSVAGTPQVVTRTPVKRYTNFHPAASGISFNARTFATNEINAGATKLYLNGMDVSASLAPLPANGSTASFSTAAGTLAANTVYAARIELVDTTGTLKSTNTFWLDTFSQSFLSTAPALTIEAEEYNYSNGVFQLAPIPVSGFSTNGVMVNGSGVGYAGLFGTPEVDYHDNRTSFEAGWNDFRSTDPNFGPGDYVGTLQGNREDIEDLNHPPPTTPPYLDPSRPNDTRRQKYAVQGLTECQVAMTEAGEWLNYTRVFPETNYYVYLRCGSFGATPVRLDLVGGNPTTTNQTATPLGTFNIPNHQMRINYAYEPLRDASGPVVVRLGGPTTLRLTMLGTATKDNRLLYLNYLLFVPTSDVPTVFDNFNDAEDANPPWAHYDPLGGLSIAAPASFIFTNGGYRIYAPSPQLADYGPARAGSFLKNAIYSDFFASVDVTDFDDTVHQAFGIAARVTDPGPGTTGGYLFSWEPGSGTLPGTSNGDLDVLRLVNEAPTQIENGPSGLHLQRGKSYRFTLLGKGPDLVAKVYELPNTAQPLITLTATDTNYTSGLVGVIVASEGSLTIPGDATFDNFLVTSAEPRLEATVAGGVVTLSWPTVPFRLQSSPSLSSPVWTTLMSGISEAGGKRTYQATASGSQYYRLVYP